MYVITNRHPVTGQLGFVTPQPDAMGGFSYSTDLAEARRFESVEAAEDAIEARNEAYGPLLPILLVMSQPDIVPVSAL